MRFKRFCLLALLVLSPGILCTRAIADVVYDSLSTTALSYIGIREIGNTITLAGSKRFVYKFTVNVDVSTSHIGQSNDYILRFYLPTAPGGYPGKLLWQSPPNTNIVLTGGTQAIPFDVPYVRVPNSFIFSVMQAGDASFILCTGPVTGTSPNYCWTNLTKSVFSLNHLQTRIETTERPDSVLLGKINHSSWFGLGGDDYYSTSFEMLLGDYWDMFGPSFYGITEWDEGSFFQMDAADLPEAVDYLTNGIDENMKVMAESSLYGNKESDTIVKSAGIAQNYPDLYGCIITDFGLKLNNIQIDHSTPGTTYFTWDVTWEIWGIQRSPDIDRNGKVDFNDFTIFASAWNSCQGRSNWNRLCDIHLPADEQVNVLDLLEFCSEWMYGIYDGFEENFETGDFSRYPWRHSGNASWGVVSDSVYEGTYAARSGDISDSGQSTLELEINVQGDNISFFRKVSSETNWDKLRFYIDGIEQNNWSGSVDWSQVSFPVTPGMHTFKWSYTKDSSISSGSDCAWIDQIRVQ